MEDGVLWSIESVLGTINNANVELLLSDELGYEAKTKVYREQYTLPEDVRTVECEKLNNEEVANHNKFLSATTMEDDSHLYSPTSFPTIKKSPSTFLRSKLKINDLVTLLDYKPGDSGNHRHHQITDGTTIRHHSSDGGNKLEDSTRFDVDIARTDPHA
ncbi:hypothetical protein E3N88_14386 [Mikania micrantha]|uniref:Uncharacterized protein n=1 Tax=Mikania micrantha TaxID=192012 RepID=A0A5N6P3W5_9ASTR|nr:hypothetical protein E3N88_14386 [Mikania micrantha]